MALFVRDGLPFVRTPKTNNGPVPEDFLVLLGIASAFRDPDFREQCLAACRAAARGGHLRGIVDYREEKPH
jgi:hypothetical protein